MSYRVNSNLVFRKEFDGNGILFDSDTGKTFLLNPTSVAIWEMLERGMTELEIYDELSLRTELPERAKGEIADFIKQLISQGYVACHD